MDGYQAMHINERISTTEYQAMHISERGSTTEYQ